MERNKIYRMEGRKTGVRDEFKINILRDIELFECVCNECGNKFKGLSVDIIECPACHSSNISKK